MRKINRRAAAAAVVAGAAIGTAAYAMMKKKDKEALKRKVKGAVRETTKIAKKVADSEIRTRINANNSSGRSRSSRSKTRSSKSRRK